MPPSSSELIAGSEASSVDADEPRVAPRDWASEPIDLPDIQRFMLEVRQRSVELAATADVAQARAIEGRVDMHEPLLELARNTQDLATKYAIANMLFTRVRRESKRLHGEVLEARPNDPLVEYEWALELHRLGRCEEAIPYYRGALRIMEEGSLPHGALAQCLLEAGHVDEAIAEFRTFDLRRQHTAFETLLEELHRTMDPWATRAELLASARGGRLDAWLDVLALDLFFPIDLWNDRARRDLVTRDLDEARTALASRPSDLRALEIMSSWLLHQIDDAAAAAAVAADFPTGLPANVRVAEQLSRARLTDPSFSEAEATRVYGPDLRRRFEAGDPSSARLLAALAAGSGDATTLRDLNDRLCDEVGALRFCKDRAMRVLADHGDVTALTADLAQRWPRNPASYALRILVSIRDGRAIAPHDLIAYLGRATFAMHRSYAWKFSFLSLAALRNGETPDPRLISMLAQELETELEVSPACDPWGWPGVLENPACERVPGYAAP